MADGAKRNPGGSVKTSLVYMPFGFLESPSLALGLLQAGLAEAGIAAETHYFTLAFAEKIGAERYRLIAHNLFPEMMWAEWVFSAALFGEAGDEAAVRGALDRAYAAVVRQDGGQRRKMDYPQPVEEVLSRLMQARALVPDFLEACAAEILGGSPAVVGFSTTFSQNTASLALAKKIRERSPGTRIVFGGGNCAERMGAEILRRFDFVDAVVSGEGDAVFPELVRRLLSGASLSGLSGVYSRGGEGLSGFNGLYPSVPLVRDLDRLPDPVYDDYFRRLEGSPLKGRIQPHVVFETSRGCWWGERHHCTFCGENGAAMSFRAKSARRAAEEILRLARRYPGARLWAADTILDMRAFDGFLRSLADSGLDLDLFFEVKANLKKEHLRLLRRAGVRGLQPGIESLSSPILKMMRKGITGLQNIQFLKWCRELDITPLWALLYGFPQEPAEEYARMAELFPRISHLHPPGVYVPIRMERFSPNFNTPESFGFAAVEAHPVYRHIYPFSDDVLFNLAYHFSFQYARPQDVAGYTRPLKEAVRRWWLDYPASRLEYADDGTEIALRDGRPAAAEPSRRLRGLEREAYLACDAARTLGALAEHLGRAAGKNFSREDAEDLIAPCLERGWMLREGDAVLSLAVRSSTTEIPGGVP